jgi:anti-repressor protein
MRNLTPNTESTLIPVFTAEIGGVAMPVVNARDLHDFLELKSNYSDWIKKRVTVYKFIENEDFSLISENTEIKTGRGGDRRSIDCLLTLDMAKELGMLERNDKGRMVRKYFIDCELKIH